MTLSFEGTYTKDELFAIARLNKNPVVERKQGETRAGRTIITLYPSVIFAIGGWLVGLLTFVLGDFRAMSVLFGFVVALGLVVFWIEVLAPHLAWKSQSANPLILKGNATDEVVEIQWTSQSITSQYQWEAFRGYGEHESVIVLYMPNHNYVGVSKRLFQNDQEWEAFRKKVAAKLPVTYKVILPTTRSTLWQIAMAITVIVGMAALTYLFVQP